MAAAQDDPVTTGGRATEPDLASPDPRLHPGRDGFVCLHHATFDSGSRSPETRSGVYTAPAGRAGGRVSESPPQAWAWRRASQCGLQACLKTGGEGRDQDGRWAGHGGAGHGGAGWAGSPSRRAAGDAMDRPEQARRGAGRAGTFRVVPSPGLSSRGPARVRGFLVCSRPARPAGPC